MLVSTQRTRLDFAVCLKELIDVRYPDAERIVLVLDQLNTHSPAALHEALPPAEAARLTNRLEIHHTPEHGSWLNMAELELSVLERQCLRQRLANRDAMTREVTAWAARRFPGCFAASDGQKSPRLAGAIASPPSRVDTRRSATMVTNARNLENPKLAVGIPESFVKVFPLCEQWPSGQADARTEQPDWSDIPSLIMAGAYDHLTPVSRN